MFQDLGALLSFLGSTDPQTAQQVAGMLDAQGMPPPSGLTPMMLGGPKPQGTDIPGDQGGGVGLGSMMPGGLAVSDKDTSPATPGGDTVSQDTVGGATQAQGSLGPAVAQALKVASPTPMPGPIPGVTGGVKAPDHKPVNPAIMQGIIQLLMHPSATGSPQGPSLGSLIR